MVTAIKRLSHKVIDLDEAKGIVTVYINSFDYKDSDGDISDKSSFNRTIKNDFNRQKHLINHDGNKAVGLPIEYEIDNFGLKVHSQLNLEKEIGRDIFSDYKLHENLGRSMEHSFGFNVMQRDKKERERILEYKMWEYTTMTTWGANDRTPQVGLKGEELSRDDIIDQIYYISKAFEKAEFTDIKFKKLEANMAELVKAFELVKDSITPIVATGQDDDYNKVLEKFKKRWK